MKSVLNERSEEKEQGAKKRVKEILQKQKPREERPADQICTQGQNVS